MIPDPSGHLVELIIYITSTRVDLYSHQILLQKIQFRFSIPIPIPGISIPIPFSIPLISIPIPIPELELELSCNSNSGIELTPTLVTNLDRD